MPEQGTFRRAAIFGTGLVGGSFALALRKYAPEIRVAGWDREAVVQEACAMGAVQDVYFRDVPHALAGADLIYLALPIGVTLDVLPELLRHAPPNALITDAPAYLELGSTHVQRRRAYVHIFATTLRDRLQRRRIELSIAPFIGDPRWVAMRLAALAPARGPS